MDYARRWEIPWYKAMPKAAKLLLDYLMARPHGSLTGITRASEDSLSRATEISLLDIRKSLFLLAKRGVIAREGNVLLVRFYSAYHRTANNSQKKLLAELQHYDDAPDIIEEWAEIYHPEWISQLCQYNIESPSSEGNEAMEECDIEEDEYIAISQQWGNERSNKAHIKIPEPRIYHPPIPDDYQPGSAEGDSIDKADDPLSIHDANSSIKNNIILNTPPPTPPSSSLPSVEKKNSYVGPPPLKPKPGQTKPLFLDCSQPNPKKAKPPNMVEAKRALLEQKQSDDLADWEDRLLGPGSKRVWETIKDAEKAKRRGVKVQPSVLIGFLAEIELSIKRNGFSEDEVIAGFTGMMHCKRSPPAFKETYFRACALGYRDDQQQASRSGVGFGDPAPKMRTVADLDREMMERRYGNRTE